MSPAPACNARRRSGLLLACMMLPSFAVLLYGFDLPHLGYFKDDGVYLATAFSIANGEGYRVASLPNAPWQVKYPPLYPLLLSLGFLAGNSLTASFAIANLLNWLALPVFALLTVKTLQRLEAPYPLLLTLLCLGHAGVWHAAHSLLSDLWAGAAVLAVCLVAQRSGTAGGVLAAAAYLLRSSAITVIGAFLLEFLLSRRRGHLIRFAAVVLPVIALWSWWAAAHESPATDYNDVFNSTYGTQFQFEFEAADLLSWLPQKAARLLSTLGTLLLPKVLIPEGWNGISVAAGALLLCSVLLLPRLEALYITVSIVLLLVWPWPPFERMFVPLLPLLAAGLGLALRRIRRLPQAGLAVVLALLGGLQILLQAATGWMLVSMHREINAAAEPAYKWVRERTPADATFCAYRDAHFFFATQRRAESIHVSVREGRRDPQATEKRLLAMPEWARARGLRYAVLIPKDYFLKEDLRRRLQRRLAAESTLAFCAGEACIYELPAASPWRVRAAPATTSGDR